MKSEFIHSVQFDSNEIQNLLDPQCFYVGATFDSTEDQLPDFIRRGVWENGYGAHVPKYVDRVKKMRRGDFLIVKRLMGKGSTSMKVLAVGVVVGVAIDNSTVLVAWALPSVNIEVPGSEEYDDVIVPLKEIGTVSTPQQNAVLDPKIQTLIDKCRVRFLRQNLDIKPRHYL